MKKINIAYFPISKDLSHPADRRRLAGWAKSRNHNLIINEIKNADLLFISEGSDFYSLSKIRGIPKIFDLVDGYLAKTSITGDVSRGLIKTAIGQHKTYPKRYTSIVSETCRNVDMVICSSPEQQETINQYNINCSVILDNHSEFPLITYKEKRKIAEPTLFWEGTTFTLKSLNYLVHNIVPLKTKINIVTDVMHPKLLGKYCPVNMEIKMKKRFGEQIKNYLPWSINNVVLGSKLSSLGVIPAVTSSGLQYLKPENRLLIMFRLGIPCITADIPSYRRVESHIMKDVVCKNETAWKLNISKYLNDDEASEDQVLAGQKYLSEFHTEEILFSKWDKAIESLL